MKHKIKPITIKSRNLNLSGQLYIPKYKKGEKLPAVVFYQGRGCHFSKYEKWMEEFARRGIVGLIYDLGGIGESGGKFSEQTISNGYEDAVAGIEYLAGLDFVDMERIGILGGSYGGYLGSILASAKLVKSLVLEAPANFWDDRWEMVPEKQIAKVENLDDVFEVERKIFLDIESYEQTKSIRSLRSFRGRLLVIYHGKDDLLPEGIVKMFYDNAAKASEKKYKILKEAPHSLTGHEDLKDEAAMMCGEWMKRTLQ